MEKELAGPGRSLADRAHTGVKRGCHTQESAPSALVSELPASRQRSGTF